MLISASGHVKLADFGTCVKVGNVSVYIQPIFMKLGTEMSLPFRMVWFDAAQLSALLTTYLRKC